MTILDVCKLVAPKIGINVPSVVFTGTTRTQVELQALAIEMSERIAKHYDWQKFKIVETITGDGVALAFDMPADFERFPVKARLWPSAQPSTPMAQIMDEDEWLGMEVQDFDTIVDRWIIYGDQIHINPVVASAETVKYFYQSNLIVAPGSGDNKIGFTADNDTTRLNERTLKLGMIWQWKANKGLPYAEDLETYEEALAIDVAKDRGPRVISVGRPRTSLATEYAFPQSLGS